VLTVTGTNFEAKSGATNDVTVANLTLTGQGGSTYTLTSADVEITSATEFSVTLNAADKLNINGLLNKDGTSAVGGTAYALAVADDWMANVTAGDTSATGKAITTTGVVAPTITSATYDASTGALVVTGSNLVKLSGATNDVTVTALKLVGEGGAEHTLTSSSVEITSGTSFSVTLNATDLAALGQIMNKTGTASTGGATYNLVAADDWNTTIANTDAADATNAVDVSSPNTPTIISATYNASTGALVVTGTGFLKLGGATNDVDVSKLKLVGEGGAEHTLTTTSVEITSGTSFSVTLNATDLAAVNQILNKTGLTATGGATFNLAGAEDWAAGAEASVNVVDATGNGITVSNPTTPTITSATYNASTGVLVVTGTGFLKLGGATNDVVANKLTLEAGAETYTLTDTSNVDIASGTGFTVTLSATDKAAVNQKLNNNGLTGTAGLYNLKAAEDWAAGADAGVNVVDVAGNGVTVSGVPDQNQTNTNNDQQRGGQKEGPNDGGLGGGKGEGGDTGGDGDTRGIGGETNAMTVVTTPVITIVLSQAPSVTGPTNTGRGDAASGNGAAFTAPAVPGGFQVAVVASGGRAGGQSEGLAVNRGMQDAVLPAEGKTVVAIPPDAFAHTDPNASVALSATQADGQALPNWVSFDPQTGKFTMQPPPGAQGVVTIKVVARDDSGKEAVTTFKVVLGAKRTSAIILGKPGLMAQMKDVNGAGRMAAGRMAVMETVRQAANG
jgi:hypothetical protein